MNHFLRTRFYPFNPFDSHSLCPKTRQALLVLVPLRLAQRIQTEGDVAWAQALIEEALSNLAAMPGEHCVVVRQLFFQLLALLLAKPVEVHGRRQEYERLGALLASMRRANKTLPFNPVLAYEKYERGAGAEYLAAKLDRDAYRRFAWLLTSATLEEAVESLRIGP